MIAASFTAWQILQAKGLQLSFNKYLEQYGLAEPDKLSKIEIDDLIDVSLRIIKKTGKRKK
jgi:hypothetical protein